MGKKTTVTTLATSRRKVKRPARASGLIAATEKGRGGRASMKQLHADYQATFAALPDDYETLKDQAVYLGKLSGHAFVLMAARLKRIRDLDQPLDVVPHLEQDLALGRSLIQLLSYPKLRYNT